jgi:MFS family permease
MIIMPVIVPIFKSKGLSMEQIYQLQAIFAIGVAVLEVPSGYISDLFSRKTCLILAGLCYFLGELGFLLSDNFLHLALAEVVLAIGLSLYSGTDVSLVYDSLSSQTEEKNKGQSEYLSKLMFWGLMAESVGGLIGGYLASFSLDLVLKANAAVSLVPLFFAFRLKEPERNKLDKSKHWENFRYIAKELFLTKPLVRQIIFVGVTYSLATILSVWSFQELWTQKSIPIHYFGYLWFAVNFVGALSSKFAYRIEKRFGVKNSLYFLGLWPIIMYFLLGASLATVPVILVCCLMQAMRGFSNVVVKDALNSRVGAEYRATANSILGLGFRLAFSIFGPLFGFLIDKYNIATAYQIFGFVYVAAFFLILLPTLRYQSEFRTS